MPRSRAARRSRLFSVTAVIRTVPWVRGISAAVSVDESWRLSTPKRTSRSQVRLGRRIQADAECGRSPTAPQAAVTSSFRRRSSGGEWPPPPSRFGADSSGPLLESARRWPCGLTGLG
jgi:hypothetical protein